MPQSLGLIDPDWSCRPVDAAGFRVPWCDEAKPRKEPCPRCRRAGFKRVRHGCSMCVSQKIPVERDTRPSHPDFDFSHPANQDPVTPTRTDGQPAARHDGGLPPQHEEE
jgi:hypothetical protein